jgi:hypothetical protein
VRVALARSRDFVRMRRNQLNGSASAPDVAAGGSPRSSW